MKRRKDGEMSSGIFFVGKLFFCPFRILVIVFNSFLKCQVISQQCYFLFCVQCFQGFVAVL